MTHLSGTGRQNRRSSDAGGWNTTMSPTLGWLIRRLVSTRWPIASVGTIDGLGIRYGLTTNAWIRRASPTATATVSTSSANDFRPDLWPRFIAQGSARERL